MLILLAALLLLILLSAVSWLMAGYSMGIRRQTLEEARQWQESRYDLSWYDALDREDYTVAAEDGYLLHVQRLVNPSPEGRCVVISHGYTDNRFGALKYAKNYLELGYDIIVYEHPVCGESKIEYLVVFLLKLTAVSYQFLAYFPVDKRLSAKKIHLKTSSGA